MLSPHLQPTRILFTAQGNFCLQGSQETSLPGLISCCKRLTHTASRAFPENFAGSPPSQKNTRRRKRTSTQISNEKNPWSQETQSLSKWGTSHFSSAEHSHPAWGSSAQAVACPAANEALAIRDQKLWAIHTCSPAPMHQTPANQPQEVPAFLTQKHCHWPKPQKSLFTAMFISFVPVSSHLWKVTKKNLQVQDKGVEVQNKGVNQ